MRAIAELAVEAVGVQQRHEKLEVLFLAVMGCGGHQQEVPRDRAQQLAQLEALGLVDLVAEIVGRQLVRFVDDHQVPVRQPQLFLQVFGASKLVDARDHQVGVVERVAAAGLLDLLA